MENIEITTEYITLDQFLKYINVVASGGEAKLMIKNEMVQVNGEIETRRGRKLYSGDKVEVEGLGSWLLLDNGV